MNIYYAYIIAIVKSERIYSIMYDTYVITNDNFTRVCMGIIYWFGSMEIMIILRRVDNVLNIGKWYMGIHGKYMDIT